MKKNITNRYEEISKDLPKGSVIVFKGFDYLNLEGIPGKFYEKWNNVQVDFDVENKYSTEVLTAYIDSLKREEEVFWMTFEEFIISYEKLRSNINFAVLTNNLYHSKFPYNNTIINVDKVYKDIYYEDSSTLTQEQNEKLSEISNFYGDLIYSKNTNNYYVVYNEDKLEDIIEYNLFEINNENVEFMRNSLEGENVYSVELTDDEIPFLDLIEELKRRQIVENNINIVTMIKLEDLPNDYLVRVNLLNKIYPDKNFYFSKKTIKDKTIKNINSYLKILNEFWGYDNFRSLDIYQDVRSSDRKLIKISQAQIINDIVEQASIPLQGDDKSYRDIFITSPTGSGKSLMFQIPSIYLSRKFSDQKPLTIIISPLIALMNDQVDEMKTKGIDFARTIHSNTPPYERDNILQEISDGKVSMLYLSPETLQARYDIKTLIGERRLALLIVDEAHIVTTWGKSFRADYWYLGIFLQKLRKTYNFPIVTFTATAIYGGREDMYLETRDSLNMINPISYFGKVKRDDIAMLISASKSEEKLDANSRDYKKAKTQLTLEHLERAFKEKKKSLIYFATVKDLRSFYSFLRLQNNDIFELTGCYHGQMLKEEKDEVLSSYKSGEMQFVLATKAFGMGVDIKDITYVYHYSPSGSVTDYVQEIGRVARNNQLVPLGFAQCDFLPNDFTAVKRLYGMSAIRKHELVNVMDKIVNLYQQKGNNRNLLISAEDFKNIFSDDADDNNLDNKVKTALLMIEKDFSSPDKLGYPPFASRPRGVFGADCIFVNEEILKVLKSSSHSKYIKFKYKLINGYYDSVYSINLSELWEKEYKNLSFPNFKRMIFEKNEHKNLKDSNFFDNLHFCTGLTVSNIEELDINNIVFQFNKYIKLFSDFLSFKKRSGKFFTVEELGEKLKSDNKSLDKYKSRSMAQALINACFEYQKIREYNFIKERPSQTGKKSFNLLNSFEIVIEDLSHWFTRFFKNKEQYVETEGNYTSYYYRGNNSAFNKNLLVLSLAESLGLLSYNVENGNSPQIYIRINSVYPLERAIKGQKYYTNSILDLVMKKHFISIEMLTYLFKHEEEGATKAEEIAKYTKFFWNKIEDYFLGELPKEVVKNLQKKYNFS